MQGKGGYRRVVVTGLGLVTALGSGVERVWKDLLAGRDATGDLSRFPAEAYRIRRACEVPARARSGILVETIAAEAAEEALAQSGVDPEAAPERFGLILGTLGSAGLAEYERQARAAGRAGMDAAWARSLMPGTLAARLAVRFGCEGSVATVLAACASGNHAIALARRRIRSGEADTMLAGGADVLTQTQYTHFHNLRSLSPGFCRPFDRHRRGLVIGEGAAFLVLEEERRARARGAELLARVLGAGSSSDAHHMTAPDPTGAGAGRALSEALRDAQLDAGQVQYVSAHGTGTPHNDRMEGALLGRTFGPRLATSSIKSMIGHCMGAASAIEAVVCVLSLRDQCVPPTIHFEEPDPECPVDCVPNCARELPVKVAVNNAFGFGGNNSSVVLGAHA